MKSILCTCAVFLVLPWKLNSETFRPSSTMKHDDSFKTHGSTIRSNELNISTTNRQTTHSQTRTRQDEGAFTSHKTTLRTARSTIFSKPNGKTTNSQTTIRQHEVDIIDKETTIRSATSTMSSSKNTELDLKSNDKITNRQTTIRQHEVNITDKETTTRSATSTMFSSKNTELDLKTNDKITNSQTTIRQHEVNITDNKTTIRSATSTMFSPKDTELHLRTNGKTTNSQTSTLQHEVTLKGNETTIRHARSTNSNNSELELKSNGEITHSQITTSQQVISIGNETTIRSDKPTIYTIENMNLPLKTNTTNSPATTGLHEGHETTTNGYKSMTSLLQTTDKLLQVDTKDKYSTEESNNILSSTSPPQTLEHQHVTGVSNAENLTHTVMSSGGESRSSSRSSFVTALTRNLSDKVTTRRNVHETLHNFNYTSKGLDIYTHENQTPRTGAKETFKPQTDVSTQFEKTPEVITSPSGIEVKTTRTVTTKWSSRPHASEGISQPILVVSDSNGTLDISNDKRNDTVTYPLNASTTTGVSTLLSPNVDKEGGTTNTTDTLDTKTTYEITKDTAGERKSSPERRTTPIIQTVSITTTTNSPMKDNNNESHPGRIVAFLIATILCLMLIAFVVIMFKNRQKKKKQKDNPDWAGPSPFIEADINPQLPSNNEDGSFHNHEFKRISLHSFLPQRLSKRLSMLSPTEEEIPLEDAQASSTFGKSNVEPLNGNATQAQIQNTEENSPPTKISLDTSVPEAVNNSPPTENDVNIPTTPKPDEVISPPPAETDTSTQSTFEDVDLNLSPEKNPETSSPSNVLHVPSPPLAPS